MAAIRGLDPSPFQMGELDVKQAITGEIQIAQEEGLELSPEEIVERILRRYKDEWHTARYAEILVLLVEDVQANPWGRTGARAPQGVV